jgi:hypothetical protein
VTQELVRELVRAQLPLETTLRDRLRVQISEVDVQFEAGESVVLLDGRVTLLDAPDTFADFTLTGSLRELEVDEASGMLTGPISLDHATLRGVSSGAAPPGVVRDLMEGLAGRSLGALGDVVPPVEIPMHLDHEIASRGYADERVQVAPARMGLKVRVKRLVPLSGRLWIQLEIVGRG